MKCDFDGTLSITPVILYSVELAPNFKLRSIGFSSPKYLDANARVSTIELGALSAVFGSPAMTEYEKTSKMEASV